MNKFDLLEKIQKIHELVSALDTEEGTSQDFIQRAAKKKIKQLERSVESYNKRG